jgi:hypothetical protein
MPGAMLKHAGSICPSHAQKCHVRTNATNATNARVQDSTSHLTYLSVHEEMGVKS